MPDTAPYGASHIIELRNLRLNEGAIAAKADAGVHKAVYLGDTSGNASYTGEDAALIARVAVGLDTGFDAHAWTDPVIVGDISGDGTLSAYDASLAAQKAVLMPVPEIPAVPGLPNLVEPSPGVDPNLLVASEIPAEPGQSVTIPVGIDDATDARSATFHVYYEETVLASFDGADNGDLWPAADGWSLIANEVEPGHVVIAMYSPVATATGSGDIATLDFTVDAGAVPGTVSPVAVEPVDPNDGGLEWHGSQGSVLIEQTQVFSELVDRHIFYNNSVFDGNDPAANANDDFAIAPDKVALLPGETATFANYTSYSRGINGVMVDIAGLPGTPTAADFALKVGNSSDPGSWADAPAPASVTVRAGAGTDGSDRVTITWADNDIQKQWLQVTVLATAETGLAEADVFYFGNAIGESGNSALDAKVDANDMLAIRSNPRSFLDPAPIDFAYDLNRDARVNATDMLIARDNQTHFLNALKLITVPEGGGAAVAEGAAIDDLMAEMMLQLEQSKDDSGKDDADVAALDLLLADWS